MDDSQYIRISGQHRPGRPTLPGCRRSVIEPHAYAGTAMGRKYVGEERRCCRIIFHPAVFPELLIHRRIKIFVGL